MRALLRFWNDESYTWQDVTYKKDGFYCGISHLNDTDIVALEDDNRNEMVRCSVCGELFTRDSEHWAEHITPVTDTSKCFTCKHLKADRLHKIGDVQYELQSDGTYKATACDSVILRCARSYSWNYPKIESQEARTKCEFNKCASATLKEITDIFTEHPDVFENIITVDKIIEVGYKERNLYSYNTKYRLKGKYSIWAIVNNLNIVDCFIVKYRNENWYVYYSHTQKKFYTKNHNYTKRCKEYVVWDPTYMTFEAKENIKKKIASLYE